MSRDYQWVQRTHGDRFVDQLGQLVEVNAVGRDAPLRNVVEDEREGLCHLAHPVELNYAGQRPQVVVWVVVSDPHQPVATSA